LKKAEPFVPELMRFFEEILELKKNFEENSQKALNY
jgi:hypothetical protein